MGASFWDQRINQLMRWKDEPSRRLQEVINFDRYITIENAALKIIKMGVASQRDYQKTLQNMVAIDSSGCMAPVNISGDSLDEKVTRALESEVQLTSILLDDEADQKELKRHVDSLH